MDYGVLVQFNNKPHYLIFGVINPEVVSSSGFFSGYDVRNGAYLKYGTDLMTTFFGTIPEKHGDTFTYNNTEIFLQILSNNKYLSLAWAHTTGATFYWFRVRVLDTDGTTVLYSKEFSCDCSDQPNANLYMPQLLISPNVTTSSDVTLMGYSWLKSYISTLGDVNAGYLADNSNNLFNNLFGEFAAVPEYPSGGVVPVDVFGGDENNFDDTSDDIGVPEPLTGALDNGFVKSYLISAQQLYQFMADITNFNSSTVTDFFNNISLLFNNPIDAIISVKKFCLDFTQFPISAAENVYLMSLQTTATANPIYQQYIKLDIGSIDIDEYFGGFLDYPPYTRITIYLPFIGEQELNVQEVMGATIHLYYMIDFLSGHCVAHLNVEKTAGESTINSDLYQWEGNMACDIPITGQDWHQVIGNFGKNAILDITSGLTGNIGGVLNGIDGMMASPNTGKVLSGAISGASALMGVRVPYIKIENAIQSMPENFTELKGMRDGIQHTINELSGYTSVMAVNIDNVTATDDEKALIKSLLMEGIII